MSLPPVAASNNKRNDNDNARTKAKASKNMQHPSTTSLVKELGRKARQRLQEELQKRPGIVRLDTAPTKTAAKSPTPPQTSPRQKNSVKAAVASTSKKHVALTPAPCAVVRLSGFPAATTTPGHVKRFLSGVDVLRLYLPLVDNTEQQQQQPPQQQQAQKKRKRGSSKQHKEMKNDNTLTVFCQTESPAIAALALQRSGEPAVGFPDDEEEITISVTDVTPLVLQYMQDVFNNVACFADKNNKSLTLTEILQETINALHPAVQPLLQHHLIQQQHQTAARSSLLSDTTTNTIHVPGLKDGDMDPNNNDTEASRTRLETLADELRYHLPWVDLSSSSSSSSSKSSTLTLFDPKAHLTGAAVQVLQALLDGRERKRVQQFRQAFL